MLSNKEKEALEKERNLINFKISDLRPGTLYIRRESGYVAFEKLFMVLSIERIEDTLWSYRYYDFKHKKTYAGQLCESNTLQMFEVFKRSNL